MTIEEKIKLNKEIRSYKGDNQFIISLQKALKGNYVQKVEELKMVNKQHLNLELLNIQNRE